MAKIRYEELIRLAAEVLPERCALSALPAATATSLPAAGGGATGSAGSALPVSTGSLTQNLPVLGGGAAGGTAGGATGDVANQALAAAFGAGGATVTPLAGS